MSHKAIIYLVQVIVIIAITLAFILALRPVTDKVASKNTQEEIIVQEFYGGEK